MQTLTRRLDPQGRVGSVEGYKNARVRDLALDNSPEPLNGTSSNGLSPSRNVEGHSTHVLGDFDDYGPLIP